MSGRAGDGTIPRFGATVEDPARRRRADLTSAVGAGVLGGGLALLLASYLSPYAVPLLLVGALLHGWGMFDRHRLDRLAGAAEPRWAAALYWICWLSLLALAVYIAARILRS